MGVEAMVVGEGHVGHIWWLTTNEFLAHKWRPRSGPQQINTKKKKQQKNGKHLSLAPRLVEAEEEAATQQKSIDSLVIWLGTLELSGLAAPTAASFSSPSKVTN